jgi:hypothetical protein
MSGRSLRFQQEFQKYFRECDVPDDSGIAMLLSQLIKRPHPQTMSLSSQTSPSRLRPVASKKAPKAPLFLLAGFG